MFAFKDSKLIYFFGLRVLISCHVGREQDVFQCTPLTVSVFCVCVRDSQLVVKSIGEGCLLWHNAQTVGDRKYGMREHQSHASLTCTGNMCMKK